jgi:predicted nucleic acid-binding protein
LSFVLDSSVTLSWYFQDQSTPATLALLNAVVQEGAVAPALWRVEVTNGLQTALRRHLIDKAYRDASLRDLSLLPIAIDLETDAHLWTRTLALSDRFGLTIYDAVFLELAQRRDLPLASLDQQLRLAGDSLGLTLLGT